jgi:hypothetical protein
MRDTNKKPKYYIAMQEYNTMNGIESIKISATENEIQKINTLDDLFKFQPLKTAILEKHHDLKKGDEFDLTTPYPNDQPLTKKINSSYFKKVPIETGENDTIDQYAIDFKVCICHKNNSDKAPKVNKYYIPVQKNYDNMQVHYIELEDSLNDIDTYQDLLNNKSFRQQVINEYHIDDANFEFQITDWSGFKLDDKFDKSLYTTKMDLEQKPSSKILGFDIQFDTQPLNQSSQLNIHNEHINIQYPPQNTSIFDGSVSGSREKSSSNIENKYSLCNTQIPDVIKQNDIYQSLNAIDNNLVSSNHYNQNLLSLISQIKTCPAVDFNDNYLKDTIKEYYPDGLVDTAFKNNHSIFEYVTSVNKFIGINNEFNDQLLNNFENNRDYDQEKYMGRETSALNSYHSNINQSNNNLENRSTKELSDIAWNLKYVQKFNDGLFTEEKVSHENFYKDASGLNRVQLLAVIQLHKKIETTNYPVSDELMDIIDTQIIDQQKKQANTQGRKTVFKNLYESRAYTNVKRGYIYGKEAEYINRKYLDPEYEHYISPENGVLIDPQGDVVNHIEGE